MTKQLNSVTLRPVPAPAITRPAGRNLKPDSASWKRPAHSSGSRSGAARAPRDPPPGRLEVGIGRRGRATARCALEAVFHVPDPLGDGRPFHPENVGGEASRYQQDCSIFVRRSRAARRADSVAPSMRSRRVVMKVSRLEARRDRRQDLDVDHARPLDELAAAPEQAGIERDRDDRHAELPIERRRADLVGPLVAHRHARAFGKIRIERPSAKVALACLHQPAQRLGAIAALDGDVADPRHRPADDRDQHQLALHHGGAAREQPREGQGLPRGLVLAGEDHRPRPACSRGPPTRCVSRHVSLQPPQAEVDPEERPGDHEAPGHQQDRCIRRWR